MPYRASRPGMVRDQFSSTDPSMIQRFLTTRFSDVVDLTPVGGAGMECGYDTVATGEFVLGHMWMTAATTWQIDQMEDTVLVQHMRDGRLTHSGPAFGEARTGAGASVVAPPVGEFRSTAEAFDMDIVALDTVQVARFAEYAFGLPETDLRITGLSPLTPSLQNHWIATGARVRDEVLGNPMLADNAIVLDRAFRRLATAFLATFPSTASDVGGRRGRGRIPDSSLREVRAFLRAHADEPIGPAEIVALGGAPAADVAEAMYRRYDVHPALELWNARLLGVHRALRDADPETDDVTTTAARWGFTRPRSFRVAYARAFGELPEETLRR